MTPQNEIRGFSKDEIIEMATQAGMVVVNDKYSLLPFLEAFAKQVAAAAASKEREALANYFDTMPGLEMFGSTVADEIREWGQQ